MSLRPWYNKEANYQTNAKSFMDYLARTNKFLEVLIEDYEIFQELVNEELERIKFDSEMAVDDILNKWLDDGTLARIINDGVLGNKADTDWVDIQLNQLKEDIQKDLNDTTTTINNIEQDLTNLGNTFMNHETESDRNFEDIYGRISNIVSISMYDVDPTGEVDSYDGFKQALEELKDNEELLLHAGGRYLIKDTLEIETDKILSINGNGSTLEFDVTNDKDGLYIKGVHKSKKSLTAKIENGENVIQLDNITGVEKGDLIWVKSSEQFSSTRDYYKKGGTFSISEVLTNNRLMFTGVFPYSISTATVDVYSPVTVLLKNINITNLNSIPNGRNGIHVEFGYGSVFDNIKTDNFMNNIIVRNMYNTLFSHITTGRSFYTGSNESYGLATFACTHTNIINSVFASGRHGLEISGFENSFKTFIYNTHVSNEVVSEANIGFNMHQSAYDVLAVNCVFKGFGMANHTTLLNCDLFGVGLFKISEESNFTNFALRDCHFHGDVVMNTVPDGFGGAHSARHLGNIVIENNTVDKDSFVKLNIGISNVVINYENVSLINTKQIAVGFDGAAYVENLIFRDVKFTRDENMLNMPDVNGTRVLKLSFENMLIAPRYNVIAIRGRIDEIYFNNCSTVELGYNSPQMIISNRHNEVSHGKLTAVNTMFSSLPINMGTLKSMRLIASEMPLSSGASNVESRQQAVFENI